MIVPRTRSRKSASGVSAIGRSPAQSPPLWPVPYSTGSAGPAVSQRPMRDGRHRRACSRSNRVPAEYAPLRIRVAPGYRRYARFCSENSEPIRRSVPSSKISFANGKTTSSSSRICCSSIVLRTRHCAVQSSLALCSFGRDFRRETPPACASAAHTKRLERASSYFPKRFVQILVFCFGLRDKFLE